MTIGCSPGTVYTGDEMRQGKCPAPGAPGVSDGDRRKHILCLVAASQTLTNGTIVTMDGSFTVTVAAVGGAGPTRRDRVLVAVCSATATASTYIWCQEYGICSVRAANDTVPYIQLSVATGTAGVLDDVVASTSGQLGGIILTTTATGGFATAMLTYPHWAGARPIIA